MSRSKRIWRLAFSLAVGAFFVASAVAKWVDVRDFELYVFSFGFLGFDLVSLAARLLIILELGTGLWFLSGWKARGAKVLAVAELTVFSAFLLWRMAAGDHASCHCFGSLADLAPGQSLLKNLLVLAVVLLSAPEGFRLPFAHVGLPVLTVLAGVALFATRPPDFWYRLGGRVSSDLDPVRLETLCRERALDGPRLVCFFSTGCGFCRDCAVKLDGILSREGIDPDRVRLFFLELNDTTAREAAAFVGELMKGKAYPCEVLPADVFLPATNGSMPLVAVCRDGVLVQEYDLLTLDEGIGAAFSAE